MINRLSIKKLSKPVLDVELLPDVFGELNEQDQESISGGQIQRLQQEFSAELAELAALAAIALPSFLNQANKAKQ